MMNMEEIIQKFKGKEVTIQFNGATNFYLDIKDFNAYEATIKDNGKRLFINDGDKDLLFVEENDVICAMDVFNNVNIYFKNNALMQIYEEDVA